MTIEYSVLTDEMIVHMKSKNVKQVFIDSDKETFDSAVVLIGSKLRKKSSNKFKSGEVFNTVNGVVRNPYTLLWAFTFDEDDSCVDVRQMKLS